MLPKVRRVPRELLTNALLRGQRHNSANLLLSVANNSEGPSRFSFSVSKKVCKNAVDRNKFRRRGYAVVRGLLKKTKSGFLCVFSFKKASMTNSKKISFAEMEKEITDLLTASGVLE